MSEARVERRLAAILAVDVAGYSRLMGEDEEGTLAALRAVRRELGDPKIAEHRGRIVKTTGDGLLAEFASVVDAVRCAVEVQREMIARNAATPAERRIEFRMGINVGDIIIEDGDIFGDGVNIAARLEALAEPGGICLSAAAHEQVRDRLDIAFDDLGEQQVKNITRPVRIYGVALGISSRAAPPVAAPLPLPDKPSLAVLPFQNMTGDAEQEYFVDGMVEEITTAISRLPWLFVIARNSSFFYKGKAIDVKQVARELGVRYVLEGSVRKAGNRVRITGQLIDAITGNHIWADRFDGALDDIFDLQDRVASSVVGAIEPKLRQSETERAIRKPTENLGAYDLYLRALAEFQKLTQSGWDAAVVLSTRALTMDPDYAPAEALIGWCRVLQAAVGAPVSASEIAESVRMARQVIETGKDEPDALCLAAYTLSFFSGAHATAAGMIDHALMLNPNSALAWSCRGWVAAMQDQADPAIEALQRAMRLSPLDPLRWTYFLAMTFAHLVARRFGEAIDWADRFLSEQPRHPSAYRVKAVACAHLGRAEEALECARHVLDLQPAFTIAAWQRTYGAFIFTPETLAMFVDGLRKAGLPEE
jgi:TolB-like protein/class 3 adenylate cyclase